MFKHIVFTTIIAASVLASGAAYADSDRGRGHDRGKGHGYHGRDHRDHRDYRNNYRPRSGVSFYFGSPYYVTPYRPYSTTYVYQTVPQTVYVPQPVQTAQDDGYCREYTGPIRVGGHIEQGYGTACLQPDGSWKMID